MIYFTSDHHFSHKNIIQLCNRPFNSVEEMDEEMIRRWNSIVGEQDIVYYLGDFSLSIKPVKEYVRRLNGHKILVPGNHDKCHYLQHKNKLSLLKSEGDYINNGFMNICDFSNDFVNVGGVPDLLLSHFPYDNGDDKRFYEIFPRDDGRWLLHGHVHNRFKMRSKMINVGVDVWNFYPVSISTILDLIKDNPDGFKSGKA